MKQHVWGCKRDGSSVHTTFNGGTMQCTHYLLGIEPGSNTKIKFADGNKFNFRVENLINPRERQISLLEGMGAVISSSRNGRVYPPKFLEKAIESASLRKDPIKSVADFVHVGDGKVDSAKIIQTKTNAPKATWKPLQFNTFDFRGVYTTSEPSIVYKLALSRWGSTAHCETKDIEEVRRIVRYFEDHKFSETTIHIQALVDVVDADTGKNKRYKYTQNHYVD